MNEKNDKRRLRLQFDSLEQLYASYMPYIQDGALFIPTTYQYSLGDRVSLEIVFPNEMNSFQLTGEVVWITPVGAHRTLRAGVGCRFVEPETAKTLKNKIETCLTDRLNSDFPTETM